MFTFKLRSISSIKPIMSMLERYVIHYVYSNIIKIITEKHCSIYRLRLGH